MDIIACAIVSGGCETPDCNHYSDFDVYFKHESVTKSLCACHTHEIPSFELDRVIPQHGSDNVCLTIKVVEEQIDKAINDIWWCFNCDEFHKERCPKE